MAQSKFIRRLISAHDRAIYRANGAAWAFRQAPTLRKARARFRPLKLQRRLARGRGITLATRLVRSERWHRGQDNLYGIGTRLIRVKKIRRG